MVKVGFIVEGESEKLVVESPMFQQWLHDHDCTLVTPVIDAKGGGNLLPQHIEPFIQRLSHAGVERIVVLTDLEDEAHPDLVRKCRIPSDHIPIRSWPLFLARELMRDLIETLKAEQST